MGVCVCMCVCVCVEQEAVEELLQAVAANDVGVIQVWECVCVCVRV